MDHSKMGVAYFGPTPTSMASPYHDQGGMPPGGVAADTQSDQFIRKWLEEISVLKPANEANADFMKVSTNWNDPRPCIPAVMVNHV